MKAADPTDRLLAVLASRSPSGIVASLNDPSPQVARAAVARLAELDGPRAAGVLRARLLDADLQLVADLAAALHTLRDTAAVDVAIDGLSEDAYTRRVAGAIALGVLGDPRARDALHGALRDAIAAVRSAALHALAKLEPADATTAACLPLLADPDAQVRIATIRTLARIAPRALTAVSALVNDPDCLVRVEAARHARFMPGPSAQPLFHDCDAGVREAAALSAGSHQAALLGQLLAADPNSGVRRAAARTLGSFDPGLVADDLMAGIEDADVMTRAMALHALKRTLTWRGAVARLSRELASARPQRRCCSVHALATLHTREASCELWRLADDPEPDVRIALLQSAPAVMHDPASLLRYMATDPDLSVRDAARNRLARLEEERER